MKKDDSDKNMNSQTIRQNKIVQIVQKEGYVRGFDLSKLFGVSEITIRRDLAQLEKESQLERTHGGAVSIKRIFKEVSYNSRSSLELSYKEAIAKVAAEMINDGDTVFINGGSTTVHIFKYINKKNVKVITTNAGSIGQIENPEVDLILAGGLYHPISNAFYGGFTTEIINQVNANKAILGVHGISCLHGLSTPLKHAADASRLMIERTRGEVIVVADHSKIGLISDYVTAPINKISTIITDNLIDDVYVKEFEDRGIQVVKAKS